MYRNKLKNVFSIVNKFDTKKFREILRMNLIEEKEKFGFEDFVSILEFDEKIKV